MKLKNISPFTIDCQTVLERGWSSNLTNLLKLPSKLPSLFYFNLDVDPHNIVSKSMMYLQRDATEFQEGQQNILYHPSINNMIYISCAEQTQHAYFQSL